MRAHKLRVTIPKEPDREIAVRLPNDFPAGPAEVIVLADSHSVGNADRPYQPTSAAIEELLSFEATPEEEKILEDFEPFQQEHPFRLNSLAEDHERPSPRHEHP